MNKWVKRKWVRALRSGEYAQGKNLLITEWGNDTSLYCCLGVLIAECYPEAVLENGQPRGVRAEEMVEGAEWIADDLLAMWDMTDEEQRELGGLNDTGKDFLYIADYIESEL